MTFTEYAFSLLENEAVAFAKVFIPILVLLMIFKLIQTAIWSKK